MGWRVGERRQRSRMHESDGREVNEWRWKRRDIVNEKREGEREKYIIESAAKRGRRL